MGFRSSKILECFAEAILAKCQKSSLVSLLVTPDKA